MIHHHSKLKSHGPVRAAAAAALLSLGAGTLATPMASAADPYDKTLEQRVEALERELNTMENDSKGKDLQTTEVPTFLKAAGSNVQQLTISGDLRFRYDYDNEAFQYNGGSSDPGTTHNELQRSRELVRLRLNLNYTLSDNFYITLGVATNGQSDSQNQNITEGFDDYGIYLHQFVLGWNATPWATFTVGKQLGNFYNNEDAVVDFGDISPTGVTEKFSFNVSPTFNLAVNLGQYIFYDNPESGYLVTPVALTTATGATVIDNVYTQNPASTIPQDRKEDAWWSYNEVVATWKPNNNFTVTLAPAFMCYLEHGSVGLSGNAVGPGGRSDPNAVNTASLSPNQGELQNVAAFNSDLATDDLYVAMFDGDVKFPVGPFKGKFYWDYAYNIDGEARAHYVLGIQEGEPIDRMTWLAGLQIGELKHKGDWYVSADFRQYGVASIDPNLNDPNFALSRLNTQGFRINLGYNLTDWLKAEVWYYGAWNLDENIHNVVTGKVGSTQTFFDANAVQNLIVQLTASF